MATIKQKLAFKEVVNGGSTLSAAMRKAGYAETTSKKTEKLTATAGWQELMDKHIPDKLLAKKHREGLEATKTIYSSNQGENAGVEPDYAVRHKYLDSAYKLKGRYANGEDLGNKTLIINISGQSNNRYGVNTSSSTDSN